MPPASEQANLLCHTYHHLYGLNVTCLRFFTVYGPRNRPDLAVAKFTSLIDAGKTVPVFGDGTSRRDYTYIADIVDGIVAAIDRCEGYHVYNLGHSEPVELRHLIASIEAALGKRATLDYQPWQAGDVAVTYADIAKARARSGLLPHDADRDGHRAVRPLVRGCRRASRQDGRRPQTRRGRAAAGLIRNYHQRQGEVVVKVLRLPHPYRAMLAICSDLDETPDRRTYWEIARFLNTTDDTRMGPGAGLEVGNSIYFDMPPDQFAYWNTDDAGRDMVRTLIRSGHIDCLHSYGDLATTRAHAGRALDELAGHDCRLPVWVDHSKAVTNFGADIMLGQGDLPASPAYHADLTLAHGVSHTYGAGA